MDRDVVGDQVDTVRRAVNLAPAGILLFQVRFLAVRQAGCDLVEPSINSSIIDINNGPTFLIDQWGDRAVLDGILHRISVKDRAELVACFVFFQQRGSREGDEGCVGQRLPHPLMVLAALAAVPLIDQNDDFVRGVLALRQLGR